MKPTLETLRAQLRAPLPKEAIKPDPRRPKLSAINPVYILERINDVFGENGWTAKYHIIENGAQIVIRCDFTAPRWKIFRQAFGGNANEDRGDAYKSACTDSLGKVASHLGIGNEVRKRQYAAELKQAVPGRDFDPTYEAKILGQQPIEPAQIREFVLACRRTGKSDDEVNAHFAKRRIASISEMFKSEFNDEIKWANKLPDDLTETWQAQLDQTKAKPANGETIS